MWRFSDWVQSDPAIANPFIGKGKSHAELSDDEADAQPLSSSSINNEEDYNMKTKLFLLGVNHRGNWTSVRCGRANRHSSTPTQSAQPSRSHECKE